MTLTPARRGVDPDRRTSPGDQVAALVALAIAGVAVLLGVVALLAPSIQVALVALAAGLLSTGMIMTLAYRVARRGDRSWLRSVGRAAWEGLKFLGSFP